MPRSTVDSRLPGHVAEVASILQDIHADIVALEHESDGCQSSSDSSERDGNGDDHEPDPVVADADNTLSHPNQRETVRDESWRPRKRVAPRTERITIRNESWRSRRRVAPPTQRQAPEPQPAPDESVQPTLDNVEDEAAESDSVDNSSDDESDDVSTSTAATYGSDSDGQHDVEHAHGAASATDHDDARHGDEEVQWHGHDTVDHTGPAQNEPAIATNASPAPIVDAYSAVPISECRQLAHFHIFHNDRLWNVIMAGVYHRLVVPAASTVCNDPQCMHTDAATFRAHIHELNRNSSATPGTAIQVWFLTQGSPPPAYRQVDPIMQHEKTLLALQIMSRMSAAHEAQGDYRLLEDYVWPMFEAREGQLAALDYRGEVLPAYYEIEWGKSEPPVPYTWYNPTPPAAAG